MPDDTAPEPSMDEILASIRKIISDDGASALTAAHPAEEPLLLTERVDPIEAKAETPMTPAEPTPQPAPPAPPKPHAEPADTWVSEAAATQAGSAFDKLSSATQAPPPATGAITLPPPERNLEDVARELLRPMLKAWLDEHLPGIVQERVDEEVERIARRRVR